MSGWSSENLLALAREHGTPLYVLDLDRVRAQVRLLEGFDVVRYAQKANPGSALLTALAADGLSVDAVSADFRRTASNSSPTSSIARPWP